MPFIVNPHSNQPIARLLFHRAIHSDQKIWFDRSLDLRTSLEKKKKRRCPLSNSSTGPDSGLPANTPPQKGYKGFGGRMEVEESAAQEGIIENPTTGSKMSIYYTRRPTPTS